MTTALADLPLWAMYAVMLGWALVRGAFFYAVGASTRVDRPLVQRLTARFTKGPVQTAMTKVERLGGRAVTTTYVVPGLAAATQVVAGMTGMNKARYAVGFVAAAAPWAVVEALVGDAVLEVLTSGWVEWAVAGAALVLAVQKREQLMAWGRGLRRSVEEAAPAPVTIAV